MKVEYINTFDRKFVPGFNGIQEQKIFMKTIEKADLKEHLINYATKNTPFTDYFNKCYDELKDAFSKMKNFVENDDNTRFNFEDSKGHKISVSKGLCIKLHEGLSYSEVYDKKSFSIFYNVKKIFGTYAVEKHKMLSFFDTFPKLSYKSHRDFLLPDSDKFEYEYRAISRKTGHEGKLPLEIKNARKAGNRF